MAEMNNIGKKKNLFSERKMLSGFRKNKKIRSANIYILRTEEEEMRQVIRTQQWKLYQCRHDPRKTWKKEKISPTDGDVEKLFKSLKVRMSRLPNEHH